MTDVDSLYGHSTGWTSTTNWFGAPAISPRSSDRGYDAVHLAGAERLQDAELVLVVGDGPLLRAAGEIGPPVART